ncbi:retrovirus-related pol polyprotein LINE-1 [Tanacetum coccineum]
MPGISLVEAIHLIRSLMKKYKERQRDLHMAFLDLEKAYDSIPRKVAPGIGNQHIPFCFDELPRGIQEDIPWCLIFADDIVLVSESTEVEIANNDEVDICIRDNILLPNESFLYLGSMIYKSGRIDEDGESERIENAKVECGRTMFDMIPNGMYRVELEVESVINVVEGLKRMGRPKLRWEDRVKHDMKELLLSEDMTYDRSEWRAKIRFCGEERIVSERLRQKLNEVNTAAQSQLAVIQDHVNFTLQKAYFRCNPVSRSKLFVRVDCGNRSERLNRSLMVCQDKYEAAKLQKKTGAMQDMESCVNLTIEDNVKSLPHMVAKLKASLAIDPTTE